MRLRRSGAQFFGKCPFHVEHTPSFSVSPAKQVFHCHGCHAGGDVFHFIRLCLQCGFRDSVAHLAARAGFDLTGFTPSPDLVRRVAQHRAEEQRRRDFVRFVDERIEAIATRHRELGRAATRAEECLRAGGLTVGEENLAWDALQAYFSFQARIEREGLCEVDVIREEWERGRRESHAA